MEAEAKPLRRGQAIVMIACSEVDSDLYYRTRFLAPDPFCLAELADGRRFLLTNELEFDRARAQARVDRVLLLARYLKRARRRRGAGGKAGYLDAVAEFLREHRVRTAVVPARFPAGHAEGLRKRRIRVAIRPDPFWPGRLVKTPLEIAAIRATQQATEEAVAIGIEAIRRSRIRGGRLYSNGRPLTAEAVRGIIHRELLDRECLGQHTIIACGGQGVDPHNEGSGPLRPDVSIILDVFPRGIGSRYFADMTRTVVKGRATPRLKEMYRAVLDGQQIAFDAIRDGADGLAIHKRIQEMFESRGFRTGLVGGRMQGFFHGTGHGVGLDIHEPPRISSVPDTLRAGEVVTVEPGLYYAGTGGVRLEDMVLVTGPGCRNLTRFPKELEL